ncbi:hypothetical protein NBRC110019_18940 [Neptunitalea chrysea]|uniref:SPOR domain-containing protein n=1 Tax=Neptunitalea chrysea TaxID=1647581 RepID=A0A9W6B5B3_9FLAO|nr:SPOR domain-containing protein [Neptunitalea chrysea]GLB52854.1 hypothetical protein NBRC110019_18940 [Neptunitalea chrysea]
MKLENYISELLYRYECVTIPGFGAFLTSTKGAQVHTSTNAFYPPTKMISFNKQVINNDGLLANYIASVKKLSYDIALIKIETSVFEWQQTLNSNAILTLKNLGEFWLNNEGSLQFNPSQHVNYLTSSFGLSTFVSPEITREQLHKEVETIEKKTPITLTPEARKTAPSYLKYAAVFVLGLSVAGSIGYNYLNTQTENAIVAEQDAQEKVTQEIQNATFFDELPLELAPVQLTVTKKVTPLKYHIVAGAFRDENNAHTRVAELKEQGYEHATILGQNKFGLWQVSLQGFEENREAERFLFKNRKAITGIWLFVSE